MNTSIKDFSRYSIIIPLCFCVAMTGCGGNAEQVTEIPEQPPETTTPPPQSNPDIDEDSEAPVANILFPSSVSKVESQETIWVRGTASDQSGISEVLVNGIQAQLNPTAALASKSDDKSAKKQQTDASEDDSQSVEWAVQIPVSSEIIVEATDSAGNRNEDAARATILTGRIPGTFVIDNENQQLFGFNDFSNYVFKYDLVSGTQERIRAANRLRGQYLTFSSEENKIFTARFNWLDSETKGITLALVNPENAAYRDLISYSPPHSGGQWDHVHISGIDYLPANNNIYLNLHLYSDSSSVSRSHVIEYNLNLNQISVVVDGISGDGKHVYGDDLKVTEDGIYLVAERFTENGYRLGEALHLLALDGSSYHSIVDAASWLISIHPENPKEIYNINLDFISKIDLDAQEHYVISEDTEQTELNLSQPSTADIDVVNNRLLVSDSDLDMIIGVDLDTGGRSKVLHNGVGDGKNIIRVRAMVFDELNEFLYVADDGGNADEAVFRIDLSTGNRLKIGAINQHTNDMPLSLALDNEEQQLYVLFNYSILKIDLETEVTESFLISSTLPNDSRWFSNMVLDKSRNRLLTTVGGSEAVYAIDLDTRQVSHFQDAGSSASSTDVELSNKEIIINREQTEAQMMIVREGSANLHRMSLSGNDKQIINDICGEVESFKRELEDPIVNFIDSDSDRLLIEQYSRIYQYDFQSENCYELISLGAEYMYEGLMTENGRLLYGKNNSVNQFDLTSGQSVIISK